MRQKTRKILLSAAIVAMAAGLGSCTKKCMCTFYDHGVAQVTTLDNEAGSSGRCADLNRTRDDGGVLTGIICTDQ